MERGEGKGREMGKRERYIERGKGNGGGGGREI